MKEYQVKEIANMTNQQIDAIQNKFNTENLQIIEKAYQDRRINLDDYEYLRGFYQDGMGVYREVYRALYEVFKHPEFTCAFDPKTGNVDRDTWGHHINYGLRAVTPFTCTRLEYVDKFHNPVYVILPKMKSAERAVEKLELEYGKEYARDLQIASRHAFENEDREAFAESLQNITKSTAKLHDILRLTITCKYFTDVERIERIMTEQRGFVKRNYRIDEKETRNRFKLPLNENEKKYYDIKMIMHQINPNGDNLDVEVQLKIQTLYNADICTHPIYENIRAIRAELAQNKITDPLEIKAKQAQLQILTDRTRRINENAIHQYNMMVIDKARRFEDDGYRPLRIDPDYPDGTYQQCRQFIDMEYLVESYAPFNEIKAFSAQYETNRLVYLRMIGKLDASFNEFADDASEKIDQAFKTLTPAEQARLNGINEVARRYAPIIKNKINTRWHADSQITLPNYKER